MNASTDPALIDTACLRAFWTGKDNAAKALQASVTATAVKFPRQDLPLRVVQVASDDGLLPTSVSSERYVARLQAVLESAVYAAF